VNRETICRVMSRAMCRALATAVMMAVTLAACSIGKPLPQPTTYVIDLPGDEPSSPNPPRQEALRLGNVRVAAPFAGRGLVYRFDEVRYVSDPYQAFSAEPAAMLASRIAKRLDSAGLFRAALQPGDASPARYVLEVSVTDLYGDFREGRTPAAVTGLQFTLVDTAGTRPRLIYERSVSRAVPLPQATPEALVRGYGMALGAVVSQLLSDLDAVEYPR